MVILPANHKRAHIMSQRLLGSWSLLFPKICLLWLDEKLEFSLMKNFRESWFITCFTFVGMLKALQEQIELLNSRN